MYQETSRQAYNSIEKIDTKRKQVLDAILKLQPCTDKEIANYLGWEINRVTGRRNELAESGIIHDAGKKKQNDRNVIVWKISKPQLELF